MRENQIFERDLLDQALAILEQHAPADPRIADLRAALSVSTSPDRAVLDQALAILEQHDSADPRIAQSQPTVASPPPPQVSATVHVDANHGEVTGTRIAGDYVASDKHVGPPVTIMSLDGSTYIATTQEFHYHGTPPPAPPPAALDSAVLEQLLEAYRAADAPAADPAPPLPHVYPPSPFVIRHADVADALHAQWQRAQAAVQRPHRRQVTVLTSRPGYGRRALLDDLATAQTEAGGCVLRLVFVPDNLGTEPPEAVTALHARTVMVKCLGFFTLPRSDEGFVPWPGLLLMTENRVRVSPNERASFELFSQI